MKKLFLRFAALCLCCCLILPTAISATGLDLFTKKNTYQSGQFSDVSDSAWYANSVKTCYELGLMSGYEDKTFRPNGNITLAECIVIAARVHNIYRSGLGIFDQSGTPWYDIPVKYAISSKIITSTDFSDYTKSATRAQMAYIFSSPLPESELTAINTISSIPDVAADAQYSDAIYLLYRAGVLTGRGDEGYFDPDSAITRGEAAAIISRIVVPSNRKAFTLKPVETTDPGTTDPGTTDPDTTDPGTTTDPDEPDVSSGTAFSFSDVQSFSEGFAVVSRSGGYGYINTDGTMLTGTSYAAAYPFSEGKGVVLTTRSAGGYSLGFVNRDGDYTALGINIGTGLAYTGTDGMFSEGLLLLEGAAPALIDETGAFFPLDAVSVAASVAGDGLILIDGNLAGDYPDYRYVDSSGSTVIDLPAAGDLSGGMGDAIVEAGPFHNGMAPVCIGHFAAGKMASSSWGFIDLTGKVDFSGLSSKPAPFEGGVTTGVTASGSSPAIITGAGSVISLTGFSTVLEPSHDSPLIGIIKNNRYGFVNKTGAQVIAPQFTSAQPFCDGLSAVTVNGKCGFIDENGDWAFSPVYDDVRSFSGGFGWGEMNGLWYILEY